METLRTHILVIEDENDILDLLTYNLVREGYSVTGITNGEQALQMISHINPNLILLDLMLPGVEGLQICRLLKTTPETADIPVIMVTAKNENADIVKGLETGADDYVAKPFNMKVLLARIRTALQRKREPVLIDETPRATDTVINLLRQIEGGLQLKINDYR